MHQFENPIHTQLMLTYNFCITFNITLILVYHICSNKLLTKKSDVMRVQNCIIGMLLTCLTILRFRKQFQNNLRSQTH